MTRSESLLKLLPALIAARTQFPALVKDSENPHFKSRYADLASVVDACTPALAKNGLAVLQTTRWADGALTLDSTLAHISGEWIASEYPVSADYSRPQLIGAALTYSRRYSLMALTGLAPEDDDGETASGRGSNGHAPPAPRPHAASHRPAPSGNGHTTRPALPAPAPRAASATVDGPRVPVSGSGLYRWACEHEKLNGPGMLASLTNLGAARGWGEKIVSWSVDRVILAFEAIADHDQADDGDDFDDDGRDDDRGEY